MTPQNLPKTTADELKLDFQTSHTSRRDETRLKPTSKKPSSFVASPGVRRALRSWLSCIGHQNRIKYYKNVSIPTSVLSVNAQKTELYFIYENLHLKIKRSQFQISSVTVKNIIFKLIHFLVWIGLTYSVEWDAISNLKCYG